MSVGLTGEPARKEVDAEGGRSMVAIDDPEVLVAIVDPRALEEEEEEEEEDVPVEG